MPRDQTSVAVTSAASGVTSLATEYVVSIIDPRPNYWEAPYPVDKQTGRYTPPTNISTWRRFGKYESKREIQQLRIIREKVTSIWNDDNDVDKTASDFNRTNHPLYDKHATDCTDRTGTKLKINYQDLTLKNYQNVLESWDDSFNYFRQAFNAIINYQKKVYSSFHKDQTEHLLCEFLKERIRLAASNARTTDHYEDALAELNKILQLLREVITFGAFSHESATYVQVDFSQNNIQESGSKTIGIQQTIESVADKLKIIKAEIETKIREKQVAAHLETVMRHANEIKFRNFDKLQKAVYRAGGSNEDGPDRKEFYQGLDSGDCLTSANLRGSQNFSKSKMRDYDKPLYENFTDSSKDNPYEDRQSIDLLKQHLRTFLNDTALNQTLNSIVDSTDNPWSCEKVVNTIARLYQFQWQHSEFIVQFYMIKTITTQLGELGIADIFAEFNSFLQKYSGFLKRYQEQCNHFKKLCDDIQSPQHRRHFDKKHFKPLFFSTGMENDIEALNRKIQLIQTQISGDGTTPGLIRYIESQDEQTLLKNKAKWHEKMKLIKNKFPELAEKAKQTGSSDTPKLAIQQTSVQNNSSVPKLQSTNNYQINEGGNDTSTPTNHISSTASILTDTKSNSPTNDWLLQDNTNHNFISLGDFSAPAIFSNVIPNQKPKWYQVGATIRYRIFRKSNALLTEMRTKLSSINQQANGKTNTKASVSIYREIIASCAEHKKTIDDHRSELKWYHKINWPTFMRSKSRKLLDRWQNIISQTEQHTREAGQAFIDKVQTTYSNKQLTKIELNFVNNIYRNIGKYFDTKKLESLTTATDKSPKSSPAKHKFGLSGKEMLKASRDTKSTNNLDRRSYYGIK